MNIFSWKHLWIGGFFLAAIRGLFEFIRLSTSYPVLTDTASFFIQTLILYLFLIGVGGGILVLIIWLLSKRNRRLYQWFPVVWLFMIVSVDTASYLVNTPES